MLVRVNDDGIGMPHGIESLAYFIARLVRQDEITAISGIDMHPHIILSGQRNNVLQRIDRPHCRRAQCRDDHRHATLLQAGFERIDIHARVTVCRHGFDGKLQYATDARMRVMRLA